MLKVLVFGTGDYLEEVIEPIEASYEIIALVDNQIEGQYNFVDGKRRYKIITPMEIKELVFDKVVIVSMNCATEIFGQLLRIGVKEHDIIVDFVSISKKITTRDLLESQFNEFREMNRLDIIVKYLAIENFYKKNAYGYELYKRMQKERLKIENTEVLINKFEQLISSFKKGGFRADSYIICDQDMRIMDGAHRLACSLYFNIPSVQIKILSQKFKCNYGINWFLEHGFSLEEMDVIHNKLNCLLKDEV